MSTNEVINGRVVSSSDKKIVRFHQVTCVPLSLGIAPSPRSSWPLVAYFRVRSPKVGVCIQISLEKYSNQGCGLGLSCDQAAGNLLGDFQLAF